MSFAAGDRLWGRGTATAQATLPDDDGFLDFSQALDHVERKKLPPHQQLWFWLVSRYAATNKFFQGSSGRGHLGAADFEIPSEPDFVPTAPPRAVFDEEAFLSNEPPGISTPVIGVLLVAVFIASWVQGGFVAGVFLLALSALLTSLYVLSTGRASWARIESRKTALIIGGSSLLVAILCKVFAG